MGTDIHLFIERKQNNIWKSFDLPIDCDVCDGHGIATRPDGSTYNCVECNWNDENKYGVGKASLSNYIGWRNYVIFAILGNVRNGFGFIDSISNCRGIPKDADNDACNDFLSFEHSASWVSLQELIDYDVNKLYTVHGIISRQQYDGWDKKSSPESWRGWVSGPEIKTINEDDLNNPESYGWTNIRVHWKKSISESCKRLIRVRNELQKFCIDTDTDPNDIRLVFDFDS